MSIDRAQAHEGLGVAVATQYADQAHWHADLLVRKYDQQMNDYANRHGITKPSEPDFAALGIKPYEEVFTDGNLVTTAGWGRITTLLNAGTGNLITSTTARVGAGNGSTAAAIGDTDLSASSGSSNRYFMTSTVTVPSSAVLQFVAAFGSSDGNFAWSEWGIDIGTATVSAGATVNAVLLNRKVASNGTKASGQTWTATATITFS
jgi:hypothetical protein